MRWSSFVTTEAFREQMRDAKSRIIEDAEGNLFLPTSDGSALIEGFSYRAGGSTEYVLFDPTCFGIQTYHAPSSLRHDMALEYICGEFYKVNTPPDIYARLLAEAELSHKDLRQRGIVPPSLRPA
jgi:hypothetical protein